VSSGVCCVDGLFHRPDGHDPNMLMDILIAVVIVAIAAVLGIVVHPLLWLILIVAALWLFGRGRTHAHR